ncbi:MAG: hypothetical protein M1830_002037 [Pleopsidium flavum]|nr:MAG: hypothetical protein M1830_002037 [Pleopsidium flavum]
MKVYSFRTLYSFIALLISLILATASPAPGSGSVQARFNCPTGPSPAGVSQYLYPDLYIYCISNNADCDCYPVAGRTAHLNLYEVRCRRSSFSSHDNLMVLAAAGSCKEKCMCYGGPADNWVKHPYGPAAKGLFIEGGGPGGGSSS